MQFTGGMGNFTPTPSAPTPQNFPSQDHLLNHMIGWQRKVLAEGGIHDVGVAPQLLFCIEQSVPAPRHGLQNNAAVAP